MLIFVIKHQLMSVSRRELRGFGKLKGFVNVEVYK